MGLQSPDEISRLIEVSVTSDIAVTPDNRASAPAQNRKTMNP
jgi:hypothetical protein